MNRKVIFIGAALGRVGSSVFMKLLSKSNVDTGGKKSGLKKASQHNKHGFYEIESMESFLKNTFGKFYSHHSETPTLKWLEKTCKNSLPKFINIINNEFNPDSKVIAIKGGRMLLLPFFDKLKNYEIKIIFMERNKTDQVDSILKMWKRIKGREKISNKKYLMNRLMNWDGFAKLVLNKHKHIQSKTINFESFMDDPIKTMKEVCEFLEIKEIPPKTINSIVDRKLVHFKEGFNEKE